MDSGAGMGRTSSDLNLGAALECKFRVGELWYDEAHGEELLERILSVNDTTHPGFPIKTLHVGPLGGSIFYYTAEGWLRRADGETCFNPSVKLQFQQTEEVYDEP